jgi:hypothetical protein
VLLSQNGEELTLRGGFMSAEEVKPKEEEVKEGEEEVKNQEESPSITLEEIKAIIDKMRKEYEEELKDLEARYEELLANMTEEEKEEASFEDWLLWLFEEAKKRKKKPYYYYPYYPEPKKKKEEEEAGEEVLPEGQGVTQEEKSEEAILREKLEKVAEALRNGREIREQWEAPIVAGTHEIVGHVREFLPVSRILEGKPGDTVNIATVRDFDLGAWGTYGSPTLGDETATDVISFASASVKEAGVKFYMKRHLTEKADANVLELINQVARRAVLRAEDKLVLSEIQSTAGVLSIDKSTAGVDFDADWIPEIIEQFQSAGISIEPGDLVLFISPKMYEALMKDVAGSMGLVFARPDVIQKGRLTEFMGVTIRVVSKSVLPLSGTNYCAVAFKKNGAHIFAPKRSFLVETQPDIANRQTLTTVTTAAAYALVNPKHGLYIITQVT